MPHARIPRCFKDHPVKPFFVKKLVLILLLVSAAAVAMAQERFVFTPQWTAQAQFAGYYVAQEQGFYRDAGIEVDIVHPSLTQPAMSRIRRNESQATTLQLCQAMEIIDSGIPLVNILLNHFLNHHFCRRRHCIFSKRFLFDF